MRYRVTRARREFEFQITGAIKELRPLCAYQKKNGRHGARLLAVYYVFSFSQLELYVKNVVEDAMKAFGVASPTMEKWPDSMLAFMIHRKLDLRGQYKKFSTSEDEAAVLSAVAKIARTLVSWGVGAGSPSILHSKDVLEKRKYPSPKNFPHLFRRLGIDAIWSLIGKSGRINGELILTSLNDLRTSIVHDGSVPTGFGMADFMGKIEQMQRFVAALDRAISTHFGKVIPRVTWEQEVISS